MRSSRSFFIWTVANTFGAGILIYLSNMLPLPNIIPCTVPLAQYLFLSLAAPLIIQATLIIRYLSIPNWQFLILFPILLLLFILWLGAYQFSPLRFSSGRIPILNGFVITRFFRPQLIIATGEIVTISSDSVMEIQPITLLTDEKCYWASANRGGLDDPRNCDIAYQPPSGADFDTLNILIKPGCRLPNAHGDIKVTILH